MELRQGLRRRFPDRRARRPFLLAAAGALVASCAARRPPPTASPAPPAPAGDRAYIVFFPLDSAEIGERGRQVVAEAAKNLGAVEPRGAARIELDAYADRSGSPGHNRRLSQRRAEAVAAELRRQGVRPERIAIRVHGEGRSFVPTRDGEQEAQNRGVWITRR